MLDRQKFAVLRAPRRIWAVGAIHGEPERLDRLHAGLWPRLELCDRIVYLGNMIGRGSGSHEVLDALLRFRLDVLARPHSHIDDVVYLRGSRHVPPRREAVREAMPALFDLLENEVEPSVRAVLGHWMLAYVHPYPDGNGRIARFLMNSMLASGGYPWTVIRVEDRDAYISALEAASVDTDIRPFVRFLAARVRWSMEAAAGGGPDLALLR